MHVKVLLRTLGAFAVILGCCMLLPMIVGLLYGEFDAALSFGAAIACAVALGALLWLPLRGAKRQIGQRDGVALTAFAWLLASLLDRLEIYTFLILLAPAAWRRYV